MRKSELKPGMEVCHHGNRVTVIRIPWIGPFVMVSDGKRHYEAALWELKPC